MIRKNFILLCIACFLFFSPIHALVGTGFHWGFDFTLDMEDTKYESITFSSLIRPDTLLASIDTLINLLPDEIGPDKLQSFKDSINNHIDILNSNSPISFMREGWARSVINFGGKVFFDAIPILDAIDISFNVGAWEYKSVLRYPTGNLKKETITMDDITTFLNDGKYENFLEMDTISLTLERFGFDNFKAFGISQTPFIKLQFDLTIRKNLVAIPNSTKLLRLYLGLGPSLQLGTPVLTHEFIMENIRTQISNAKNDFSNFSNIFTVDALKNLVFEKLLEEARNPTFGMHFVAGTMIKIPVIPAGIYLDAKYMLPFGDIDDVVDLGGFGFFMNIGICLAL